MQRTLALGALWTASAGAAVGLGFLAVSLVDASASPGTTPAGASTSPDITSAAITPFPTPTTATGQFATVAGTAYANCTGGTPVVAGAAAAGWWVDDSNDAGEVEFENGTQKLEVHVVCVDGAPQFSVEGPRPARTPSPPATSSTAETTRGGDDDGGDDNSGPGSDDSGGEDNSGSGSDDSGGDDDSGSRGDDD
jgi:hypothetical protein